jgi:hypothetical protein
MNDQSRRMVYDTLLLLTLIVATFMIGFMIGEYDVLQHQAQSEAQRALARIAARRREQDDTREQGASPEKDGDTNGEA